MSYAEDVVLYRDFFRPEEEQLPLTPIRDAPVQHTYGRKVETFWNICKGTAAALVGAGGVALKVYNLFYSPAPSDKLDTAADVIMGASSVVLADTVLPKEIKQPIVNELKRSSVFGFEVATNVYLNIPHTTLVRKLFFTPINMATGALLADDILTLSSLTEVDVSIRAPQEKPIPMTGGDAKSLASLGLTQPVTLAGIISIILGLKLDVPNHLVSALRPLLFNLGLFAAHYGLGKASGFGALRYLEKLDKDRIDASRSHVVIPSEVYKKLNAAIKIFQLCYPGIVGISLVPNTPAMYAVSGFVLGAGNQITRTFFQYRATATEIDDKTFIEKVKRIWETRKKDLAVNALFLSAIIGWTIWGEIDGGVDRIRAAVAVLSGSIIGSTLLSPLIDFAWKPQNYVPSSSTLANLKQYVGAALSNSLFYNTIVNCPAPFLFLLLKRMPNDVSILQESNPGYYISLASLIMLAYAIGSNQWLQMREGRMSPALTPVLARAFFAWTTMKSFLGVIDQQPS